MCVKTSLKLSLFIVCVVNGTTTDGKQVLNVSNNVFWCLNVPGSVSPQMTFYV